MKNSRSRILVAALAAAFSIQASAESVPTGPRCDGAAMVICAPVVAAVLAKKAIQQGSSENRLADALKDGNAAKAKPLLKKRMRGKPDPEKVAYLETATEAYLKDINPAKQADRLDIVKYILGKIDLRGEQGATYLHKVIGSDYYTYEAKEKYAQRRLALVKAAIASGANGRDLDLGACQYCEIDEELLPLLFKNGGDPANAAYLLNRMVERQHYDAARRLIGLGVNPNGEISDWQGPLHLLAEQCNRKEIHENLEPQKAEQVWQQCVKETTSFAKFAVGHGADPNGQSSVETLCDTPYSLALKSGNKALAETLRTLGADPGFAQRCKSHAPAGAVP